MRDRIVRRGWGGEGGGRGDSYLLPTKRDRRGGGEGGLGGGGTVSN